MAYDITYILCSNGCEFEAECNGKRVGNITFAKTGTNKIIIDHTGVDAEYKNQQIGLNLVRHVAELARQQKKKIFPLCPFARTMFNRYSEFDDVRLSH